VDPAGAADELIEGPACLARSDVPQSPLDGGFELRAKYHQQAGDRHQGGDRAQRQPDPSVGLKSGLAQRGVQDRLREGSARVCGLTLEAG
jgi:hypothetical protein